MDTTPNLSLPYIAAAQAQKHVTHNEAIRALDAIVQLTALDRDLTTPPATPTDGERYVVGSGATDARLGRDDAIAAWQDGAWAFYPPQEGWLLWVADEDVLLAWSGSAWVVAGVSEQVAHLGINATSDDTNRLALKSDASLFSHDDVTPGSGDHHLKINKSAVANTASVLFQTGFSGRAEFGLAGDDDWHVKVSPDGTNWFEALVADRSTGRITFPNTATREVLTANRTYYVRTDGSDSNDGLTNSSVGAFLTLQAGINAAAALDINGYAVTIQASDGTYTAGVSVSRPLLNRNVTLVGNTSTRSSCAISLSSGACITVSNDAKLTASGFKLVSSSGIGIYVNTYGKFTLGSGGMDFGACGSVHVYVTTNATCNLLQNYTISGSAANHLSITTFGTVNAYSRTITLSGAPAFSGYFAICEYFPFYYCFGCTFSGSATGSRYLCRGNSIIETGSAGASYLPGDAAGSVATQGQYL